MKVKDRFIKAKESVDRWLWKLVGKENDIIFHFLRFVLAGVLLAVLVALAVGVGAVLWKAVLMLVAGIVAAAPYLVVIAVIAGIVAIWVSNHRWNKRQRLRELESANAQKKRGEERQRAKGIRIRQSVHAADQKTRDSIETVLASLRRFDLRLELAITPAHYTDLFGDNWVNVREFAQSLHGRKAPEVSGLLVEIIIAYRQAQDIRWIPENLGTMQSWWGDASRKRKWLSGIVDAAQAQVPLTSDAIVLDAEVLEEPELLPIPEMAVTPPLVAASGRRGLTPIPEMAVMPPPAAPGRRPQGTSPIPEMAVTPPPAPSGKSQDTPPTPVSVQPPASAKVEPPRKVGAVAFAPKLSVPPTLEELQRYCEWVNGNS